MQQPAFDAAKSSGWLGLKRHFGLMMLAV